MTRIEIIKSMTAYQMAYAIFGAGFEEAFNFCKSRAACYYLLDKGKLENSMCRMCLAEWLEEPPDMYEKNMYRKIYKELELMRIGGISSEERDTF